MGSQKEKSTQTINFSGNQGNSLSLCADKIYTCQFGYLCESETEDEFLSFMQNTEPDREINADYVPGKISGFQFAGLDGGKAEGITKKGYVVHYEFFGKKLRGDKAMLIIKCFSKDGKISS